MTVVEAGDALRLKEYFLESNQAEKMARGVREVVANADLAIKTDLKAEIATAKLQVVG